MARISIVGIHLSLVVFACSFSLHCGLGDGRATNGAQFTPDSASSPTPSPTPTPTPTPNPVHVDTTPANWQNGITWKYLEVIDWLDRYRLLATNDSSWSSPPFQVTDHSGAIWYNETGARTINRFYVRAWVNTGSCTAIDVVSVNSVTLLNTNSLGAASNIPIECASGQVAQIFINEVPLCSSDGLGTFTGIPISNRADGLQLIASVPIESILSISASPSGWGIDVDIFCH
jgi:hypothetical protein